MCASEHGIKDGFFDALLVFWFEYIDIHVPVADQKKSLLLE